MKNNQLQYREMGLNEEDQAYHELWLSAEAESQNSIAAHQHADDRLREEKAKHNQTRERLASKLDKLKKKHEAELFEYRIGRMTRSAQEVQELVALRKEVKLRKESEDRAYVYILVLVSFVLLPVGIVAGLVPGLWLFAK